MSNLTIKKTIEYIKSKIHSETKTLRIQWFGGEPLLNVDAIDEISKKIIELCKEKNISYIASITTNGILINGLILEKMRKEWCLKNIQITLDGTKRIYERIKGFEQKNAFEKIISIIQQVSEIGVLVDIRLNYDKDNFNNIMRLISFLKARFKGNKLVKLYARNIFAIDFCNHEDDSYLNMDKKIFFKLYDNSEQEYYHMIKRKFRRKSSPCGVFPDNMRIINADGRLGKCAHLLIDKSFDIGNLCSGEISQEEIRKVYSEELLPRCEKCACLPLCAGGCFADIQESKSLPCFHRKEYYEFLLKERLKYELSN